MNYKHIFDDSILLIFTEKFDVKNSADNNETFFSDKLKAKVKEELSKNFDIVEIKSGSDSKAKIEISATIYAAPEYDSSEINTETIKSINLTANLFDNEKNAVLTLDSSTDNFKNAKNGYDCSWSDMVEDAAIAIRKKISEWKDKQISEWDKANRPFHYFIRVYPFLIISLIMIVFLNSYTNKSSAL